MEKNLKFRVYVNKEIILSSHRGRPSSCAISNAVKIFFPACYVINGYIVTGMNCAIELPKEASNWYMNIFDQAKDLNEVPEISFEIEIPDFIINQI